MASEEFEKKRAEFVVKARKDIAETREDVARLRKIINDRMFEAIMRKNFLE